jgi:DNA replication and repair protein RecF
LQRPSKYARHADAALITTHRRRCGLFAMSLSELRVENLRCIESAALEFSPELNLIAGENGAGKTSILEAIFLLGRGRSFRTRNSERLIRHGQAKLTVFGRTNDSPPNRLHRSRRRRGHTRSDQWRERAFAARALRRGPCPSDRSGDPQARRPRSRAAPRWLDWLVFHVEPTFGLAWARTKPRPQAAKRSSESGGRWN